MTLQSQKILNEALDLSPTERAELVEQILASFDFPARKDIDTAWAKEAEERIDAYERGEIGSTSSEDVIKEINKQINQ